MDDILTTERSVTLIAPTISSTTENQPSPSTSESDLDLDSRDGLLEDVSDHPNLNLLPLNNCGEILEQKLSNGNKTKLFEFPWMALLRYDSDGSIENLCGGSLISTTAVFLFYSRMHHSYY